MAEKTETVYDGNFVLCDATKIIPCEYKKYVYLCPVCGDLVECGPVNPIEFLGDGTQYMPMCDRCNMKVSAVGAVGKTHEEIDKEFKAECKKRGYTLVGAYPPIGGVIRQLAKWKEEENA